MIYLLIDSMSLFCRYVFGTKNHPYGGCLLFFNKIIELLEKYPEIKNVVFCLEGGANKRKQIFPEYKANRKFERFGDEFNKQLRILLSVFKETKMLVYKDYGYESDDTISSISFAFRKKFIKHLILTSDKDLLQLVREDICNVILSNKVTYLFYNNDTVRSFLGVNIDQILDYYALVGDKSDNIKGIAGIGATNASKLLNQFQNLEDIYQNIDNLSLTVKRKLEGQLETALFFRKMLTLNQNLYFDREEEIEYILKQEIDYSLFEKKYLNDIIEQLFKSL